VGALVVIGWLMTVARPVSATTRPVSTTAVADCSSGGTGQWMNSFDVDDDAYADAIAVSPDGSTVYVTGTSNSQFLTVAYDACTGAVLWSASYEVGGDDDAATALAVSPDGSTVFVTGGDDTANGGGYSTVAYDAATGAQLWVASYDATNTDEPTSVAVSPDGSTVFVTGVSGESLTESATVAYNASTGAQLWVVRLDAAPSTPTPNHAYLAVSPDSSTVFVTGASYSGSTCGFATVALAATTGTQLWAANYAPAGACAAPSALALSPDGSTLYVTGYAAASIKGCSAGPSDCPAFATVAYDTATGNEEWASVYGTTGEDMRAVDLAVSPDGSSVYVTGTNCGAGVCGNYATVAYDATTDGTQLWATPFADGGDAYANAVAVSPDGSTVFVTGIGGNTAAYDAATGAEQWVAENPGNTGMALAVSPDGSSLFVAGTFVGSATASSAAARSAGSKTCTETCGVSTFAYPTTRGGAGVYPDTDPSIRYNGWSNVFASSDLGGMYRESHLAGDSVAVKTAATKTVTWLTHRGPNMGKARVVIDGKSKGTFDLYNAKPSAGSITFTGLASRAHTIKVEVLGTKDASSSGTAVGVDGFKVGTAVTLASSPSIQYDTWVGVSQAAASGGSYRRSGSAAARVSFTFTGTSIDWITAKGPGYGRARVTIDGVAHTVDLYKKTQAWQVKIFYGGLSTGKHTITIQPLGTKDKASTSTNVVFNAFRVDP
jgi:outer membrane protein assembly factor BamB